MVSTQMIPYLAVFLFTFQILISHVHSTKPPLLTNCFVQIIYVKTIPSPRENLVLALLFDSTSTLSYSIQEFELFSLLPGKNYSNYLDDNFDIADVKVDILTGYFRLHFRLSDFCMLFLIKSPTFNESLTAIQHSGHGTSDYGVLFLIETSPLDEESEVLHGFVYDLFNSEGTPFHSPIAFFNQDTNKIAIFCYLCASSKIEFLKADRKNLWNDLQTMHFQINSNGYENLVIIPDSFSHSPGHEPCLKYYNGKRSLTNLFGEHVNCYHPETWALASIQPILNVSLTSNTSLRIEGNNHQK
ncbi:unnamed protein product [Orchesella dallaii]|uniref:Uncharacterized protein n=1 Tax=Orchesella dallaii TaxID=48710 RepID=A0ABP1RVI4_9HEXA